MPFGFVNAPSIFWRLVCRVLVGCETFTSMYIDNILILSNNHDSHLKHVDRVFFSPEKFKLRVTISKRIFYKYEFCFFGHVLRHR